MANLGPDFYSQLVRMTSELSMRPEDLLAIMVSESGINPGVGRGQAPAGLIQFMPGTLPGTGFKGSQEDFRQLSGQNQLPYIKQYIQNAMQKNGGPFTSAAQYYVANMWPAALKLPGIKQGDPNTIIIQADPPRHGIYSQKYFNLGYKITAHEESNGYKANAGLFDKDHKGAITYGDMINQVNINKRTSLYQNALANMNKQTGYIPNNSSPNNELAISNKNKSTSGHKPAVYQEPSFWTDIEQTLDKYLSSFLNTDTATAQSLLTHNLLIKISAPNYTSAIEYARVLSCALDEELLTRTHTHTDGKNQVEIECQIVGPKETCQAAVEQMCQAMSETFQQATKKIGGIQVKTECLANKISYCQPISLKTAASQYRNFHLKFI